MYQPSKIINTALICVSVLLINAISFGQTITIVSTGGVQVNNGWTYSNGLIAASQNVNINASVIENYLSSGDLTIDASSITINAQIHKSAGGDATLTLKSDTTIDMYEAANFDLYSTSGKLNLVLWSGISSSSSGHIKFDSDVDTNGGHVWIGGGTGSTTWNGLTVGDGYAFSGDYSTAYAVNFENPTRSSIITRGGNLYIAGRFNDATHINGEYQAIRLNDATFDVGTGTAEVIGDLATTTTNTTAAGIQATGAIFTSTGSGNLILKGTSNGTDRDDLLLGSNAMTVNWPNGNVIVQADRVRKTASSNLSVTASGFTFEPSSTAWDSGYIATTLNFSGAISSNALTSSGSDLNWLSLASVSTTSLTLGKATTTSGISIDTSLPGIGSLSLLSTSGVTIAGAITSSQSVTIHGENISINDDLTTNASGADILLKASGKITQAANKSITTNGGDVIFWADSDANSSGAITLANNITINTVNGSTLSDLSGGGKIVLAGGADNGANGGIASDGIPDGFASSSTGNGIKLGTATENHTQMYSGGGDIIIKGFSNHDSATNSDEIGIWQIGSWTANSGNGSIHVIGNSDKFYGISFVRSASGNNVVVGPKFLSFISNKATGAAITISGTSSTSHGVVFNYNNPKEILATGGGDISITGSGAGSDYGIFLQNPDILSSGGSISLDGGTRGIYVANAGTRLGAKTGSSIPNSISNITLTADTFNFTATSDITTSGKLTVEPSSNSFSGAISWPLTNLAVSNITGLSIGKETNTSNITIASDQSVAGPISIYGGDIVVNNAINTSTDNSHVNLLASDNITLANGVSITTLGIGGDVTIASDTDDTNGGAILGNGDITISTNDGDITLGGGDTLGSDFTNGEESNQVGIRLTGSVDFDSQGGDIALRGESTAGGNDSSGIVFGSLVDIQSGTGTILIHGINSSSSSDNTNESSAISIVGNQNHIIKSLNTTSSAITITADASTSPGGRGLDIQHDIDIIASGIGGGITINGYNSDARSWAINLGAESNILANGGAINVNAYPDNEGDYGYLHIPGITIGSKAGSDVQSSSSNINLTSDYFDLDSNDPIINTSGNVSIKSYSDFWSTFGDRGSNFRISDFTFNVNNSNGEKINDITVGKPSNTKKIIIDENISVTGNVSLLSPATSSTSDIEISSGISITTIGNNKEIVLAAGDDFINNSGSNALVTSGSDSDWIIYSADDDTPSNFGSLVGTNSNIYGQTYSSLAPSSILSGNQFVFAESIASVPQFSGTWKPLIKQANFDPNDDQQAVKDTDLVGDATNAMLETQRATYAFSTGATSDEVYYFRARMGASHTRGKLGTSFYLALDKDNDYVADVFVEANVKDNTPYVAFHLSDPSKAGTGPSNTGWQNSSNNDNIERELSSRDAFIKAYSASTDLDSDETDTWIEFAFTEESLKSFVSDALSSSIDGDSMFAIYTFTSTSQTANGDIGGIDDRTADLTKTWEELGIVIKGSLNEVTTNAILAPTVTEATYSELTPTITGTWGSDQGGTDTLAVAVNGVTYTTSGSDLTVDGYSWSLTIPNANTLTAGTSYTVSATTTRSAESKTGTGTITVLDNDSSLSNISFNNIALSPTFNSTTYAYAMSVGATVGSTTFSATTNSNVASMTINGVPTASMSDTLYNIPYGTSTVTIIVYAPDGSNTNYTIAITRSIIPTLSIVDGDATTDEDGDTAQISAVLPQAPTANVTLNFYVSDDTEGTISPSSLTFTTSNWNIPQTITVTGIDDPSSEGSVVRDGTQSYTITGTTVSSDSAYNGSTLPTQTITNQNTDPPGIRVTTTSNTLSENGSSITATFALLSNLTPNNATVTMTISLSDGSEASFSSNSVVTSSVVTLTDSASSTSVTIYGVDDATVDGTQTVSLITGDPTSDLDTGYDALTTGDVADVTLQTTDNDKVGDIYTDFGGFWSSGAENISTTKPSADHNLIGFDFAGKTYATGADNTSLDNHSLKANSNALNFDGIDDYVIISGSTFGDFNGNQSFSLQAYVKTTSTAYQRIISKWRSLDHDAQWTFNINNENISFTRELTPYTLSSTSGALTLNKWHLITATYDGSKMRVYIDGQLSGELELGAISRGNDLNVIIGASYSNSSNFDTSNHFEGEMDEVSVWNRALTEQEIKASMNRSLAGNESGLLAYYDFNQETASGTNTGATTLIDRSGNGNNGTLTNFALSGSDSNWVLGKQLYESETFQALPFSNLASSGSNYNRIQASSVSAPTGTASKTSIALSLTDGTQGLNMGSGLTNIPQLQQSLKVSVNASSVTDTTPDIVVSQVDVPSASPDQLWFENSSGTLVGNKLNIDFSAVAKQGEWLSKNYSIPGNTATSETTSPLRVKALYLSEFGLTQSDAANLASLVYMPSGVSDPAFIAYNTGSITPTTATMSATRVAANYNYATTLSPTLQVQLKDASGNNVAQANTPIVVYVQSGSATLSGTLEVQTNASGTATFEDLKINGTSDVTLVFASPGLSTITTTISFARVTTTMSGFPDFTVPTTQEPFTLTPPTTNSSAAIIYSSTNTAVATVDSSTGSVTVVAAGTTSITASVLQNDYYTAGTITATMTVNKGDATIVDFTDITKTFGDDDFTLTGTSSNTGAISYTVSDINVATVSGNTITIVGAGTTSITLTQASDANYNSATATITLTVNKATPSYTVTDVTKTYDDPAFNIDSSMLVSSSTGTLTFTVSDTTVATLTGTNTLNIQGAGSTVITAVQSATSNYESGTTSFTLSVDKNNAIILNNSSSALSDVTLVFSDPSFAKTATSSSTGAFTFSSSDTDVIALSTTATTTTSKTVSHTIVGTGTSIITVSQEADANYNAATVSYTVTVTKANPNLSAISDITKTYGAADDTVVNTLSTTTAIQYSSSNPSVVQIASTQVGSDTQTATLSFTGAGTAIVTATLSETANYESATTSFTVTVNKATPTLSGFVDITKTYGDADFSLVQPTSTSGGGFTYASSNTATATISGDTVSISHSGDVVITATQAANANYEAGTISLTLTINKATQSINVDPLPSTKPLKDFTTIPLTATSSSGNPVSITLASGSAATLSGTVGNYELTSIGTTGVITVTFSVDATTRYNAANVSLSMDVVKTAQSISYAPALPTEVTYSDGLTVPLTASASSGLGVSYTVVSGPAILTGNSLTISQTGVVVVEASQAGSAAFNPAPVVSKSITVQPGTVTLSAFSIPMKVDSDPDFTITAPTSNVPGTITYSSSNLSVANMNGTTVEIIAAGTTSITARQLAIPNKYNSASITTNFVVAVGDSDGDGVLDPVDLCPNTIAGASVDANGCAPYQKDSDSDGIMDDVDNCVTTANADQADADGDGVGDVCDNAPNTPNADQADTDGDGTPDAEDEDDDNDGVPDNEDDFPTDPSETTDSDGDGQGDNADNDIDNDGIANSIDNCPSTPNANQLDTDGDGIGNACDNDDDGDGYSDADEIACGSDPLLASSKPLDTDVDGIPDCIDTDDDNDGYSDMDETTCGTDPLDPSSIPTDTDSDGIPDCIDSDDDGDGVLDTEDAFPLDKEEWTDTDGDGIGNNADQDDDNDGQSDVDEMACGSDPLDNASLSTDFDQDNIPDCVDTDDDNDGVVDTEDAFPLDPAEWTDTDGDGIGNNADQDDDNDGQSDYNELVCESDPLNASSMASDIDGDTIPDCVDEDIDGDGCLNSEDTFPRDASECSDADGDGLGDNIDIDSDNDGVPNSLDAFPLDPSETKDADGDGIGDNADQDDNNDGFNDAELQVSGVLTPNSSGLESTWKIINLEKYPNARVTVYNKNGQEVFSAQGYRNDWRGTYKNSPNPLPAASYYYVIQLNTGEEPFTGWIYITY